MSGIGLDLLHPDALLRHASIVARGKPVEATAVAAIAA
jgi:hypothetical protein